jgi:DnaJ domain
MTAVDSDTARYANQDLYGLLHVTPDADAQLIQYGYRRVALTAHPDAGGNPELIQRLNKAKEILLDPTRRATLVDWIRGHRSPSSTHLVSPVHLARRLQLARSTLGHRAVLDVSLPLTPRAFTRRRCFSCYNAPHTLVECLSRALGPCFLLSSAQSVAADKSDDAAYLTSLRTS